MFFSIISKLFFRSASSTRSAFSASIPDEIKRPFKVLLKELQALALDVTVLDENGNEVKLGEDVDESENDSIKSLTDDDETYDAFDNGESYASAGYIEGTPDELEDAFGATMIDTESVFDD